MSHEHQPDPKEKKDESTYERSLLNGMPRLYRYLPTSILSDGEIVPLPEIVANEETKPEEDNPAQ